MNGNKLVVICDQNKYLMSKFRMDYKNKYYWTFRIESSRYYGEKDPDSLGFITEENREAWQRFIQNKINELMKAETMESPEFKECLANVQEERRKREEYDRREKELRIKHAEERQRRSCMEKPKIAYIPKGLTVDYEKEYGRLIRQEVSFVPTVEDDFLYQLRFLERWYKKSVPQLIELKRPDAAYAVAVELCLQLPDFVFRRDIEGYLKPKKPRLRKLIEGAFSALVDSVKAWNNDEKRRWVCDLIFKQTKYYHDFRGLQKVMLQMMPSEPYVGEPVAVVREKSEEDLLLERKLKREEQQRLEAEKEAQSVIPLNEDYETRIFASSIVDWDCRMISHLMHDENKHIKALANRGEYQEAALRFMQLAKSMCRHFISDEHYCYFDDLYSPEYAIDYLVDFFNELEKEGKLPEETKVYLKKAWQEIMETECHLSYGILNKEML